MIEDQDYQQVHVQYKTKFIHMPKSIMSCHKTKTRQKTKSINNNTIFQRSLSLGETGGHWLECLITTTIPWDTQ